MKRVKLKHEREGQENLFVVQKKTYKLLDLREKRIIIIIIAIIF